jgi:hypothetical protein
MRILEGEKGGMADEERGEMDDRSSVESLTTNNPQVATNHIQ